MMLTARQAQVLETIRAFIVESGRPPTRRELCARLGIASGQGINDHLVALERKGAIRRDPDVSRGLSILVPEGGYEVGTGVVDVTREQLERACSVASSAKEAAAMLGLTIHALYARAARMGFKMHFVSPREKLPRVVRCKGCGYCLLPKQVDGHQCQVAA